jgi:hypothetical protein
MANEQDRADLSKSRGKYAAGIKNPEAKRAFIAEQGNKEAEARFINATIGKKAGYKTDPITSFKKGGKVKKTGVYKLHKGERVIAAKSHPGLDY